MKSKKIRTVVALALFFSYAHPALPSDLEWPVFRHDQGQSGRSLGVGDITDPVVVWSHHVGGKLTSGQAVLTDIENDGIYEMAYIESGRLNVKSFDSNLRWATKILGLSEIVGSYDFNGDGSYEFLAISSGPPAKLFIVDALNGDVLWSFADFPEGSYALTERQILVSDINGDDLPDIVCSPRVGDSSTHGFSFFNDFQQDSSQNHIWEYIDQQYSQEVYYISGDIDNSGSQKVVFLQGTRITVLNGADGTFHSTIPNAFFSHSFGLIQLFEMNGTTFLLTIGSTTFNAQVSVFDLNASVPLWQYQWYPSQNKNLAYSENSLMDIDNDGNLEVVVSVYDDTANEYTTCASSPGDHDGINNPESWTLLVLDAQTGTVKSSMSDAFLHSIQRSSATNPSLIYLEHGLSGTRVHPSLPSNITAYALDGNGFSQAFSLDSVLPLSYIAQTSHLSSNYHPQNLFEEFDLDSDGHEDPVFVLDSNHNGLFDNLLFIDSDSMIHNVPFDEGLSLRPVRLDSRLVLPLNVFPFTLSDGHTHLVSEGFEIDSTVAVGGYTAPSISVDTTGVGKSEVITVDSKGNLLAINSNTLSVPQSSQELWSYEIYNGGSGYLFKSTDVDGDGSPEFVVWDKLSADTRGASLLDSNGNMIWHVPLGSSSVVLRLSSFGNFDDDGFIDFAFLHVNPSLPQNQRWLLTAVSGMDGSLLWQTVAKSTDSSNYNVPLQILELNGDGIDDIIFVDQNSLNYFSGTDGSLIEKVGYSDYATDIVLSDFDFDQEPEILLSTRLVQDGIQLFNPLSHHYSWNFSHNYSGELYSKHLSTFGLDSSIGIVKTNSLGKIELIDGFDGSEILSEPAWLRKKHIVFDEDEENSNILYTSVADIDGNEKEEAIFGTADGFLVAASLPDLSVIWHIDLRSSVGEPILSDVDGDGKLEIVVSTADGFVHLIDQQSIQSPSVVRDVALTENLEIVNPLVDVDTTTIRDYLGVSWASSPEASGYRVTAVDQNNKMLIPWIDTGMVNNIVLYTGPRVLDKTYYSVVQSYNDQGQFGSETLSDGIAVQDNAPPYVVGITKTPMALNLANGEIDISADFSDDVWLSSASLAILNEQSVTVHSSTYTLSGRRDSLSFSWNGEDSEGTLVSSGFYRARWTVEDSKGNIGSKTAFFRVYHDTCEHDNSPGCYLQRFFSMDCDPDRGFLYCVISYFLGNVG